MSRALEKGRDQQPDRGARKLKDVEYKRLILPRNSIAFLERMGKVSDMNLHLAQNRFGCEVLLDKKNDSKKSYSSLLTELVRKEGKKDLCFCNGKLTKLMELLDQRNKRIMESFPFHEEYLFHPYDKLILGDGTGAYLGAQPLRLHPLYGIPFIPASVIKGTLRSAWILERYGGDEKRAECAEEFVDLFGGNGKEISAREGKLRFFDIFPDHFEIGMDVQTVHYKDYYGSSDIQPTDDQVTKPVFFMCLRNAEFPIFICCRDEKIWTGCKGELDDMMENVYKLYGIGAKTALGYGTNS